jgi:hypothetical protein
MEKIIAIVIKTYWHRSCQEQSPAPVYSKDSLNIFIHKSLGLEKSLIQSICPFQEELQWIKRRHIGPILSIHFETRHPFLIACHAMGKTYGLDLLHTHLHACAVNRGISVPLNQVGGL